MMRRLFLLLTLLLLAGCERPDPAAQAVGTLAAPALMPPTPPVTPQHNAEQPTPPRPTPTLAVGLPTRPAYNDRPTPDPTRPGFTSGDLNYTVTAGDTLGLISQRFGVPLDDILAANELQNDLVFAGQTLIIPNQVDAIGPSFKIIPDSELVYGPGVRDFVIRDWVEPYRGYLLTYEEEVEGQVLAGPEIVQLIADRFSLNPRLLLAIVEHQAGWVTQPAPAETVFPLGLVREGAEGLYWQLYWAANQVNLGYYGRTEGGLSTLIVNETERIAFAPDINDGTAGVQLYLGARSGVSLAQWRRDAGPDGLFATYSYLFGNPFGYTVDPLWPADLSQPLLQLPWALGETWYFTSGPHGGWGPGSAWAALDFVPPGEEIGCYESEDWVTAMGDGLVVRSGFGAVVVDMDGDGYAGTGWVITYMHLDNRDRVAAGTWVQTGDQLGHPSCEGGFSNGSHVHVARSYNGRWVSADGAIPFVLGGWTAAGVGREYDGLLVRGDETREAFAGERGEINAIPHD